MTKGTMSKAAAHASAKRESYQAGKVVHVNKHSDRAYTTTAARTDKTVASYEAGKAFNVREGYVSEAISPNLQKVLAYRAANPTAPGNPISREREKRAEKSKAAKATSKEKRVAKYLTSMLGKSGARNVSTGSLKGTIDRIKEGYEMEDAEAIHQVLTDLLDGNRVKFNEFVAAQLADRAADAIAQIRTEMSQTMFDDGVSEAALEDDVETVDLDDDDLEEEVEEAAEE